MWSGNIINISYKIIKRDIHARLTTLIAPFFVHEIINIHTDHTIINDSLPGGRDSTFATPTPTRANHESYNSTSNNYTHAHSKTSINTDSVPWQVHTPGEASPRSPPNKLMPTIEIA